jgi:hypothetical protein
MRGNLTRVGTVHKHAWSHRRTGRLSREAARRSATVPGSVSDGVRRLAPAAPVPRVAPALTTLAHLRHVGVERPLLVRREDGAELGVLLLHQRACLLHRRRVGALALSASLPQRLHLGAILVLNRLDAGPLLARELNAAEEPPRAALTTVPGAASMPRCLPTLLQPLRPSLHRVLRRLGAGRRDRAYHQRRHQRRDPRSSHRLPPGVCGRASVAPDTRETVDTLGR